MVISSKNLATSKQVHTGWLDWYDWGSDVREHHVSAGASLGVIHVHGPVARVERRGH